MTEGRGTEITIAWDGGLAVVPPRIDLEPGRRSTGPRIIDLEADGEGWLLTIEGTAGREYDIGLAGTAVRARVAKGNAGVAATGDGLRVRFSEGEGRVTARLRLGPRG